MIAFAEAFDKANRARPAQQRDADRGSAIFRDQTTVEIIRGIRVPVF
jgi:hypothetical protein